MTREELKALVETELKRAGVRSNGHAALPKTLTLTKKSGSKCWVTVPSISLVEEVIDYDVEEDTEGDARAVWPKPFTKVHLTSGHSFVVIEPFADVIAQIEK